MGFYGLMVMKESLTSVGPGFSGAFLDCYVSPSGGVSGNSKKHLYVYMYMYMYYNTSVEQFP